MKTKFTHLLFLAALLIVQPATGQAQDGAEAAPQILTSDLTVKQLLSEPTKFVSFVIVDDDTIEEVTINGEPTDFVPGKTVVINKHFNFQPGKTQIKVVAVDEAGNRREKSFLVGYALEEGDAFMAEEKPKERGFFWKVSFSAAFENDDNPSNDLSLPVSIGDLEISGVIPDSEQPDSRQVINGTLVAGFNQLSAFGGMAQTTYSKSENEYLNSQAIFFGVGYNIPFSPTRKLLLNLLMLDINIGGEDFSQNTKFSPGMEFTSKDDEGSYKHVLGLDVTSKDFANPDVNAGSQMVLKWVYDSTDAEKLDNYHRTFALGTNDNGTDASKCSFATFDYDWKNRWESGFRWDLGFGFQYRNYENEVPLSTETGLGATRTDMPLRLSTGLGWVFNPDWSVMADYRYTFNLSNKSPYVRSISGLTLNGAF